MSGFFTTRRLLLLLAALLSLTAAVYSFIWAYYIRSLPQGMIGVVFEAPSQGSRQLDLIRVSPGSPAESAGLLPGDRIVEINGRPLAIEPWVDLVVRAKPNSTVLFTVERGSQWRLQRTVTTPVLPPELIHPTLAQLVIMNSLLSNPLFFLGVGMAALWFRSVDRNAWLLAIPKIASCLPATQGSEVDSEVGKLLHSDAGHDFRLRWQSLPSNVEVYESLEEFSRSIFEANVAAAAPACPV